MMFGIFRRYPVQELNEPVPATPETEARTPFQVEAQYQTNYGNPLINCVKFKAPCPEGHNDATWVATQQHGRVDYDIVCTGECEEKTFVLVSS